MTIRSASAGTYEAAAPPRTAPATDAGSIQAPPRGRRAGGREEQPRQPDVPENEPGDAARERDEEAPEGDSGEHEGVHSLEYVL